jgi:hypothetical protein
MKKMFIFICITILLSTVFLCGCEDKGLENEFSWEENVLFPENNINLVNITIVPYVKVLEKTEEDLYDFYFVNDTDVFLEIKSPAKTEIFVETTDEYGVATFPSRTFTLDTDGEIVITATDLLTGLKEGQVIYYNDAKAIIESTVKDQENAAWEANIVIIR